MSGVASPPPAPAPSAARADDLFALAKFVQSEDAQARLRELQQAEDRAKEWHYAAEASVTKADGVLASLREKKAQHETAVERFKAEQSSHHERLALREAALAGREASILQREDRCTQREREHETVLAAFDAEMAQRDQRLSQRERELDARARAHEEQAAAFSRKRTAVEQAMRT